MNVIHFGLQETSDKAMEMIFLYKPICHTKFYTKHWDEKSCALQSQLLVSDPGLELTNFSALLHTLPTEWGLILKKSPNISTILLIWNNKNSCHFIGITITLCGGYSFQAFSLSKGCIVLPRTEHLVWK